MTAPEVVKLGQEVMVTAMLVAMPTVLVSLSVGLIISIFQTVTSIQEQTLSFVPRIIAAGLVLVLTLPWTLRLLTTFTYRVLWQLAEAGR